MVDKTRKSIPMAAMERLLKTAGATRVSYSSKKALAEAAEKTALELAKKAVKLAKHGGRKTVKAADVELAYEDKG